MTRICYPVMILANPGHCENFTLIIFAFVLGGAFEFEVFSSGKYFFWGWAVTAYK